MGVTEPVWARFTRMTNDPKLAYLEQRLTEMGIKHRRNGDSRHAPIMEVPEQQLEEAYKLLMGRVDMGNGRTKVMDDIPDDDILFAEGNDGSPYEPSDWLGKDAT